MTCVDSPEKNGGILVPDNNPLRFINSLSMPQDSLFAHKIFVEDTFMCDKEVVLDSILTAVKPEVLLICNYTQEKNGKASFKVCQGLSAIKIICAKKMTIPNLRNNGQTFKLKIILNYETVEENLNDKFYATAKDLIVNKRFKKEESSLDLNEFAHCNCYFPLSNFNLFHYCVSVCKILNIKVLCLSRNNLCEISVSFADLFPLLEVLDLSHNSFKKITDVKNASSKNLTQLYLKGNLLCSSINYVKNVQNVFPNLTHLDGVYLNSVKKCESIIVHKNFLCKYEGRWLIDLFLTKYYANFDKERSSVQHLYHKDACFTFSTNHTNIVKGKTCEINKYRHSQVSRNLLGQSLKNKDKIFFGPDDIFNLGLGKIGSLIHNHSSFTIDLMVYTETFVVLVLTGLLKLKNTVFGFSRTFVLTRKSTEDPCYLICNDQFQLYTANLQQINAFYEARKSVASLREELEKNDKAMVEECLEKITGLNREWCKRIAVQNEHVLDQALKCVTENIYNYPKEAFMRPEKRLKIDDFEEEKVANNGEFLNNNLDDYKWGWVSDCNNLAMAMQPLIVTKTNANNLNRVKNLCAQFLNLTKNSDVEFHHFFSKAIALCEKYELQKELVEIQFVEEWKFSKVSVLQYTKTILAYLTSRSKILKNQQTKQVLLKLNQIVDRNASFALYNDISDILKCKKWMPNNEVHAILNGYAIHNLWKLIESLQGLKTKTSKQNTIKEIELYLKQNYRLTFDLLVKFYKEAKSLDFMSYTKFVQYARESLPYVQCMNFIKYIENERKQITSQ